MPYCPYCHSSDMRRYGIYRYGNTTRQRWLCRRCGGVTSRPKTRIPRRRHRR